MKNQLLSILFILITGSVTSAQTLQTVVNNGNTVTTPVRFNGRADFGESYDPGQYGALQIARATNQGSKFHLSFIRSGQMVYGMRFLNNSNVFGIQPGSDNSGSKGIFMLIDGKIGIGTSSPNELLSVKGKIRAQEIKVELTGWADFVFAKDYKLPSLQETENHIKEKGHLPGIPSAAEVHANGVELGEMNKKLLQKIEELTLHLIEQKKKNDLHTSQISELTEMVKQLKENHK